MKKSINEYFLTLQPVEGYVLTDYTEDKPIKEYQSFVIMCMPLGSDIAKYYEITTEKDAEYKELQRIAFEQEEYKEEYKEEEIIKDAKNL